MLNNTRTHENLRRAREFRKNMSLSERKLWEIIRKDRMGFRFRRQVRVDRYFLDFYCPEAWLCVEVDGEQHAQSQQKDSARDAFLLSQGIETLRIPSLWLFDSSEPHPEAYALIAEALERKTGRRAFEPGW